MAVEKRSLIVGNWKMNGLSASAAQVSTLVDWLDSTKPGDSAEAAESAMVGGIVICPPATLLSEFSEILADSAIMLGGQDCHTAASGAYTGDISAEMLADAGAEWVILGHSERRTGHGESNDIVSQKLVAALQAGLRVIVCVGEDEAERADGEALNIVSSQLTESLPDIVAANQLAIAYEPVWAIGGDVTAGPDDIGNMHGFIHSRLLAILGADGADVPVLYGGSVKPDNAAEVLAIKGVDGLLVGGASLEAADFLRIIECGFTPDPA